MFTNLLHNRNKFVSRLSGLAVICAAVFMSTASVSANDNPCFQVQGHYDEHAVSQTQFAGEYNGTVKGDFSTSVTLFLPEEGNPPPTNVAIFRANTVIHAEVHGKHGDLMIMNAGAVQQVGEGNIVDLQIITGGTGELANATGAIRASGLFDPASFAGSSQYEGMICLP